MEAINLRLAHQPGQIFHELAESFAGRGLTLIYYSPHLAVTAARSSVCLV